MKISGNTLTNSWTNLILRYFLNNSGETAQQERRAHGARPRGMSHANSLRVAKGGACPPLLNSYILSLLAVFQLFGMAVADAVVVSERIPHRTVYVVKNLGPNDTWIGTEDGAARFDGKNWTIYRTPDGLPHNVVTSIAVDLADKSFWFGTFGGVAHLVNGKMETFTTKNSGLVNDVVYGVAVNRPFLWVATTNGISRLNLETREWTVFNDTNAPLNEVWVYGVEANEETRETWFAVWGSGLLRVMPDGKFISYQDPDDLFDVDVVRNDGPLHEIEVSVSTKGNVAYAASYFGLSRFDGKNWNTWTVKDPDSGLPSDFINVVKQSPDGKIVAIGTDKGLCLYNHSTGKWTTYRKNRNGPGGELVTFQNGVWKTEQTPQAPAGDFIWSVDFSGNKVWVGTATGLYTANLSW